MEKTAPAAPPRFATLPAQMNFPEQEERILAYKINRRKRYLAVTNRNYAEWMKSCSSISSGAPAKHDVTTSKQSRSGPDVNCVNAQTHQLALLSPHMSLSATQEVFLNC